MSEAATIFYKRATFVTHLPVDHSYTASHCWLAPVNPPPADSEAGRVAPSRANGLAAPRWRVGYTRFALRMLGEIVDVQFEKAAGTTVSAGDVLGSIEGFKALSDIYCVGHGSFAQGNPALREGLDRIARDPYNEGWMYEFIGHPEGALDVNSYRKLLDTTIDRLLAKQREGDAA